VGFKQRMEQIRKICIKARLVGQKSDGAYTSYVFQNLDTYEYVLCTRLPNWHVDVVKIAEDGFLEYHHVIGGKDIYYDNVMQVHKHYLQDATYFLNFVPITKVLHNGNVVDVQSLTIG